MKFSIYSTFFQHLKFILQVYFAGILFFTLFRLLLVFTNLNLLNEIAENKYGLLLQAMLMGWRFDTVIACYFLAIPVVALGFLFLLNVLNKPVLKLIYYFIGMLFSIGFLICSTDIPFFKQFFTRLNDTIFNWMGNASFGFKMIAQEPSFFMYFVLFVLVLFIYWKMLLRILKNHIAFIQHKTFFTWKIKWKVVPLLLLVWGVVFLGIRGRMNEKSPIIPGTAYFSNNAFINQLGLNPVFTLLRSTLDNIDPENQRFQKLDDEFALQTMSKILRADDSLKHISPIARMQVSSAPMANKNIVLIMMESMSAGKMRRYGNPDNLTPFLDSLAANSWVFNQIYSSGIHTYNGVYSTLFGHPGIMNRHTMNKIKIPQMAGFSNVLSQHDYKTIFFTTHDEQFDNMSGFLKTNMFDKIVGEKDYPISEIKSTLGVPDEYMFRFSINKINEIHQTGRPFFAAFLTGSDHDPHVIPENTGFTPRHSEKKKSIVEYADWSLQQFIKYASAQQWFQNTIFVFVADHGSIIGNNVYDIPLSYHRIPFIIFSPQATPAKEFNQVGLQTDVFATVTSLVLPKFINNTFSMNLLSEQRSFHVFTADDKLACISDSLMFVYRTHAASSLYKYKNNDTHNYIDEMHAVSDTMKKVGFSWLQTSQWMLEHEKCGLK